MLALIAASLSALQADELAEAAKKTAALENYSFKEYSKASKGKHQLGPVDGPERLVGLDPRPSLDRVASPVDVAVSLGHLAPLSLAARRGGVWPGRPPD